MNELTEPKEQRPSLDDLRQKLIAYRDGMAKHVEELTEMIAKLGAFTIDVVELEKIQIKDGTVPLPPLALFVKDEDGQMPVPNKPLDVAPATGADTPPVAYKMLVQDRFDLSGTREAKAKNFELIKQFLSENAQYPFPEPYVDLWNMFAERNQLPKVQLINQTRKRKVAIRVKEKAFDWIKILQAIQKANFLLEKWKITFDWLMENENNYLRVLEGNYQ